MGKSARSVETVSDASRTALGLLIMYADVPSNSASGVEAHFCGLKKPLTFRLSARNGSGRFHEVSRTNSADDVLVKVASEGQVDATVEVYDENGNVIATVCSSIVKAPPVE